MRLILTMMGMGVALILGPIAHHAYYTSQFLKIVPAMLDAPGGVKFAELPTTCYAFADGTGFLLIVVASLLGIRALLASEKAKKAKTQA